MAKYVFWMAGICVFMFLLQIVIPGFTDAFVLDGSSWIQPWRFLTAIFLHGGIGHLFYNMFALLLFGFMLEQILGSRKFLMIFLGTGIFANIVSINFYSSSLGASGAIFGIIGALVLIRPGMTVWAFSLPMPMFVAGILWAAGDILGAVSFLSGNPVSNTGNIAHLSGMFLGLILGLLYRKEEVKFRKNRIIIDEGDMRRWEDYHIRGARH